MSFECQRFFFFLFFVTILLANRTLAHEVSPDKKFIVIQTPHFQVIVNAKQQELGQYYSKYLEVAYDFMKPLLKESPESTVVILNDKTDSANGYATRVPYPHIMLYPVLPSNMETLAESGNWPLELVTHEYTHILSFEATSGFIGFFRNIFGSVMAPNILLPNWWKEGIAVQAETMVGNHGRLRSVYQDASLRAMFLHEKLRDYTISEINENLPTWPEGMRSYLFGSLMWSQLVADKGEGILDDLTQRHGARVPYFINGAAEDATGVSYGSKYNEVLDEVSRRISDQLETLKTVPLTETQVIQPTAKYSLSPTISPNGQYLAMITIDDKNNRAVQIYQRSVNKNFVESSLLSEAGGLQELEGSAKIYDSPTGGSIHRVSWSPDSSELFYDKIDFVNSIDRFSDLYSYNLKTQKVVRLTKSVRAREPSPSPEGDRIVFIQLSASKTSLALLNLKTKKILILKNFPMAEKASSPVFMDSQNVLFSLRKPTGEEQLYTFNLKNQKLEVRLANYPQSRFPILAKDGFYFTSAKNGTYNIYHSSSDFKQVKPVTNTLTSFLNLTWDPTQNDLYSTEITDRGPQVVWINNEKLLKDSAVLPEIKPLLQDRYKERKPVSISSTPFPKEDYSSWMNLGPKYWIPFITSSSQSQGLIIQAFTGGFDPLKKHSYQLQGSYDTGIRKPSFAGSYVNSQFWTQWGLQGFQSNSYFVSAENTLTNTGGQISVFPYLWNFSRYMRSSVSWKYLSTDLTNSTNVKRTGPGFIVNYEDISEGGDQVSPESGWSWYLGATQYLQQENYLNHAQYLAGTTVYWSDWLPKHHAIMMKFNSVYVPEEISSLLGNSTDPLMALQDSNQASYVMRGYTTGHFLGRTLANINLEYRFPIRDIYRGSGTDPFFVRRLHGAIVSDAISLEGLAYRWQDKVFESVSTNRYFFSAGAELRFETTVGYVIPITFVIGSYQGLSGAYSPTAQFGFNMQIGAQF